MEVSVDLALLKEVDDETEEKSDTSLVISGLVVIEECVNVEDVVRAISSVVDMICVVGISLKEVVSTMGKLAVKTD